MAGVPPMDPPGASIRDVREVAAVVEMKEATSDQDVFGETLAR
jgi:hypothetical protein